MKKILILVISFLIFHCSKVKPIESTAVIGIENNKNLTAIGYLNIPKPSFEDVRNNGYVINDLNLNNKDLNFSDKIADISIWANDYKTKLGKTVSFKFQKFIP